MHSAQSHNSIKFTELVHAGKLSRFAVVHLSVFYFALCTADEGHAGVVVFVPEIRLARELHSRKRLLTMPFVAMRCISVALNSQASIEPIIS